MQGGKLNRGLALVESFAILTDNQSSKEETKVAMALGWAIELVRMFYNFYFLLENVFLKDNFYGKQLQAFFLVADDIMDGSHTRRTKPCWYLTNNLGVKAFNDAILLESFCFQIVTSFCRGRPYSAAVLQLFHDVYSYTQNN